MRNLLTLLLALALIHAAAAAQAASQTFTVTVEAGKHDRRDTPIRAMLALPISFSANSVTVTSADGKQLPAQITLPGLATGAEIGFERELHFVLPALKAGQTATFTATVSSDPPAVKDLFIFHVTPDEYEDISLGDSPPRTVLRYMHKPLDESSKESRELTYKPFHHVYSPDGKQLLTKGPGGQYTHHRGLFFGFNRVTYGDNKKADVWHCTGDAHQSHEGVLAREGGAVLARHRLAIDWHGVAKEVFAKEQREVGMYNIPGGHLIEFASRVSTAGGSVKLDGDPQHAGFHFRAAQEVAEKTKSQTYYLRQDGKAKPGETRNWSPQSRQGPVNLDWNAMSFVVGDKRYTAVYLDHRDNPKEARYSERDYGRFGSYFEYDLTPERPLNVKYRVWIQEGELTGEQAAALSHDFIEPPRVAVK